MANWKLIASTTAFDSPWLVVKKKTYAVEGNAQPQDYYVVERRPFVLVVALDGDQLVMVRHFRQATDRSYLELPAGYVEPGESAVAAAGRELLEETGLAAGKSTLVADLDPLPGYIRSAASVVLCEQLSTASATVDPEIDEIVRLPLAQAHEMIVRGEIVEMQAVAAILLVKLRADCQADR